MSIQVTMSFDSLAEAAIALAGMSKPVEMQVKPAPKVEADSATIAAFAGKTKAEKPAASASAPPADKPSAASETAAAVEKPKADAVAYPVLQTAVFALAGKSREACTELLASFGVKNFKELPAERWGEALAAVQAATAALEEAVA